MKLAAFSVLFLLTALLLFSQESEVQPQIRFHYALVGSANGIDAEINLDKFVDLRFMKSFEEIGASKDRNGEDSEQYKADIWSLYTKMAEQQLFGFTAQISNMTDQNVDLDVFTDVLTLSTGKTQWDLRPNLETIGSFPTKVLRHSHVAMQFPYPQDSPDDKIRALNTASYTAGWWTGLDYKLQTWVRYVQWATPGENVDQLRQRVQAGTESELKTVDRPFFGELSLGSADIDIPLELKLTLSPAAREAR